MIRCGEVVLKLLVGGVLSFSLLSEAFMLNAGDVAHAAKVALLKSEQGALHVLQLTPNVVETSLTD